MKFTACRFRYPPKERLRIATPLRTFSARLGKFAMIGFLTQEFGDA